MFVPFFANPDSDHCWQACLQMILGAFMPQRRFAIEELVQLTGKKAGKWTTPMKGLMALHQLGFDIRVLEVFDYVAFINDGPTYIVERYGIEAGAEQLKHLDLASEIEAARDYVSSELVGPQRLPTPDDVALLLEDDYLVVAIVNQPALYGQPGYLGHSVVIQKFDGENFLIHDPGVDLPELGPRPNSTVSREALIKAMSPDNFIVGLRLS